MMYRIAKLHTKKMLKRRRKLRSLVAQETPEAEQSSFLQNAGLAIFSVFILGAAIVAFQTMSWTNFLVMYRDQYNLIVHGQKDYCKPIIDTGTIFLQIKQEVLNQNDALKSIEMHLRNESAFTAITVIGRTGVGKTLFAHALHEHFPWQENTHMCSWRNFRMRSEEKIRSVLGHLSDCGRNLIIIDDLVPGDMNFVQEYTDLAMKSVANSKANLIVLYVMNVASYTEEQREDYDEKIDGVRGLENVNIVEFRKFFEDELRDCIRHEMENLNYTLDENGLGEVLKSIDVEQSGCKNVRPKVLMYGQLAV